MNHMQHDKVSAFDALFTNNHIRMLKIFMPALQPTLQRDLAVYIKYLELQYTISYFRTYPSPPFSGFTDKNLILDDIIPYCTNEEKNKIRQLESMFTTMEQYQNLMEMMSLMKDVFPQEEGFDPANLFEMFAQKENTQN